MQFFNRTFTKTCIFRNYFFELEDDSQKEVEKGMDALELAQQSEASLNNLLDLEDKDDELLLQWEEKNKNASTQQGNTKF